MTDPVLKLAEARYIGLAAELERQLVDKEGTGPILEFVRVIKARGAESLAALAFKSAHDTNAIVTLQNEVKRYDELIGVLQDICKAGQSATEKLDDEAREELLDLLADGADEQAAITMGLVDGPDSSDPSP